MARDTARENRFGLYCARDLLALMTPVADTPGPDNAFNITSRYIAYLIV